MILPYYNKDLKLLTAARIKPQIQHWKSGLALLLIHFHMHVYNPAGMKERDHFFDYLILLNFSCTKHILEMGNAMQ